jgi:hypothetical protein
VLDLVTAHADRLRVLDAQVLLADVPAHIGRCADWLALAVPRDKLARHAAEVARRNAKELAAPYSPAQRAREAREVSAHFADALATARAWLAEHVLPAMRADAISPGSATVL